MSRFIIGPHIIPYFSSFAEKKVFYFSTPFWEDYLNTLNIMPERNPILTLNDDDNLKAKNIFSDLMAKTKIPGQTWLAFLETDKKFVESAEVLESSITNYEKQKNKKFIFPPFVYLALWASGQYQEFLNSQQLKKIEKKQENLLANLKGEELLVEGKLEPLKLKEISNWPIELRLAKSIWKYWLHLFLDLLEEDDKILVLQKDFWSALKEGLIGDKIREESETKIILELNNKKLCFVS